MALATFQLAQMAVRPQVEGLSKFIAEGKTFRTHHQVAEADKPSPSGERFCAEVRIWLIYRLVSFP